MIGRRWLLSIVCAVALASTLGAQAHPLPVGGHIVYINMTSSQGDKLVVVSSGVYVLLVKVNGRELTTFCVNVRDFGLSDHTVNVSGYDPIAAVSWSAFVMKGHLSMYSSINNDCWFSVSYPPPAKGQFVVVG